MASTTKAGKVCQLFHTNDQLGAGLLNAVAKDSPDLARAALAAAKLTVDDVTLTPEEQTNFLRGFTPSGALDLTSWEGYYVTQLPNGEKHALLILSTDNTVYWGPQSQIDADFEQHKVEYQLPDDGTLRFSTQEGTISLAFSRTVENGTASVGSFKGTVGDTAVDGAHAVPPIPDDAHAPPSPVPDTPTPHPNPDTPAPPPPIPSPHTDAEVTESETHVAVKALGGAKGLWSKWKFSKVYDNFAAACTIACGIEVFGRGGYWLYETYVAENEQQRKTHSQIFNDRLKDPHFRDITFAAMREKVNYPDVPWDAFYKKLSNKTVQEVNKILRNKKIDYVGEHEVSEIVEDLREDVKKEMRKELRDHAVSFIKPTVLQELDAWKAIPEHELWAHEIAVQRAEGHATERLNSLGDSVVDSITEIAVHDARDKYYANHAMDLTKQAQAANKAADKDKTLYDKAVQDIAKAKKQHEDAVKTGSQKAIAEAEKRVHDFEKEREFRKNQVEEKRQEAKDRLADANKARDRSKDSQHEAKDARDKLNKKIEKHGK